MNGDYIAGFLPAEPAVPAAVALYQAHHAPASILQLVRMGAEFGGTMEGIVRSHYQLDPRSSSGHDHKLNGKKLEQKSSRYWAGARDWKWQHIMLQHDYDGIILAGLDYTRIRTFYLSKAKLLELKARGVIKQQGNAEGQGVWFFYRRVRSHLVEFTTRAELEALVAAPAPQPSAAS